MSDWDGRPQNPERDGWHWLRQKDNSTAEAWLWTDVNRCEGEFEWCTDYYGCPEDVARYFDYLGPCHTPAEVAVQVEAARRKEREENIAACEERVRWHTGDDYDSTDDDLRADGARGCIAAIRARGDSR